MREEGRVWLVCRARLVSWEDGLSSKHSARLHGGPRPTGSSRCRPCTHRRCLSAWCASQRKGGELSRHRQHKDLTAWQLKLPASVCTPSGAPAHTYRAVVVEFRDNKHRNDRERQHRCCGERTRETRGVSTARKVMLGRAAVPCPASHSERRTSSCSECRARFWERHPEPAPAPGSSPCATGGASFGENEEKENERFCLLAVGVSWAQLGSPAPALVPILCLLS